MYNVQIIYNGNEIIFKDFYAYEDAKAFIDSVDVGRWRDWAVKTAALFGRLLVNSSAKSGWKLEITCTFIPDDDCDSNEVFRLEVDI